MIRILHIVSSLGIGSGVMSVLMNYHRNIDKEKLQFDYLFFREKDDTYEDEIKYLGGKVYFITPPKISKNYQRKVNEFFEEHKKEYAIIHCHPIFSAVVFGKAAKKNGIKHVIQHSHTSSYGHNTLSTIRNFLVLFMGRRIITDYVACSEKAKKLFFWKSTEKVFLMRNALDVEKYRFSEKRRNEIRNEFDIDKNVVIGHVGRFSNEKNHIFLLKIFKALKKEKNNAKLLLVGDGHEMETIKLETKKMNLQEDVIFVGKKSDVSAYMSAMDVFVFPSKFEGLGLVLLEAQINGLPCLASDCIPHEVKISDLLKYKSLKEDAEVWAKEAGKMSRKEKYEIYLEDYKIKNVIDVVTQYYETLLAQVGLQFD